MKKNNIVGWLNKPKKVVKVKNERLERDYIEDEIVRCNQEAYKTAVLFRLYEEKNRRCV